MAILTEPMKRLVRRQRLAFVATVCRDGTPNVSPKGTVSVWDDEHLVFADIRSPGTVANLAHNAAVEINVVDWLSRKGFRFKGRAAVHASGSEFERGLAFYAAQGMSDAPDRIRAIVLVTVERAAPLTSPGYLRGTSETEMRAQWRRYYESMYEEPGDPD